MSDQDSISGLGHLIKTSLPIIGRVGTVVGGIVSLLVVLEQVSGQIVTAIAGFILVAATVTSAIVAFHRTTRLVDEKETAVYSYSRKARRIATLVMIVAGALLIIFVIQAGPNLFGARRPAPPARPPQSQQPFTASTRSADKVERAATVITALTVIPTLVPKNTLSVPASSPTAIATLLPPRYLTMTPFPVDQMTDVNLLLQLGNDALREKNYRTAVTYFNRAVLVEATNAQAQLGLGQAYFYLNNYNSAVEPLQNALRLNISLYHAHAFLGWTYDYRQDKAKAIAEYDAFLKVAPRDDPFRQDISDRQKLLTSSTPAPTLTPRATVVPSPPGVAPTSPK